MLPDPMLAKPGPLPRGRGWAFEPKWDGIRALIRSGEDYTGDFDIRRLRLAARPPSRTRA